MSPKAWVYAGLAAIVMWTLLMLLLISCSEAPDDEVLCRNIPAPGPASCHDYMERHWEPTHAL
jgi:hypothetical protein